MAEIDNLFYSNEILIVEIQQVLSKKVLEIDDLTKIMEDLREYDKSSNIGEAIKQMELDLEKRCSVMDQTIGLVHDLIKKRRSDKIPTLNKNSYWDEFLYLNITNKDFMGELCQIIKKIYHNLMEVFSELRLAHCLLQNFKNKGIQTGHSIECVDKQIREVVKIIKEANSDLTNLLWEISDKLLLDEESNKQD